MLSYLDNQFLSIPVSNIIITHLDIVLMSYIKKEGEG